MRPDQPYVPPLQKDATQSCLCFYCALGFWRLTPFLALLLHTGAYNGACPPPKGGRRSPLVVSTIACSMRFGGIVDVGRGSHIVGRIYGDLGDSVCEDITGSIPCALCVLCTWTLLHVSTLYSVIYDLIIQVFTSLCHQPQPGRSPDGYMTS